ncbi:MAG: PilZ domain-containing protein [Sulfurifustaceae bacterium]
MSIEHRWAARQSAGLPVSIACRRLGLVRGRLLNISNGGALVQLGTRLPAHIPVELILPGGDATKRTHLPAVVTRSSETGVGLMFGRLDPDTWTALLANLTRAEDEANGAAIPPMPAASR